MQRPSSSQQWSQRRTTVLLGLCKTPAPPDFQAQVMARLHERQRLSAVPRTPQACSSGLWQGLRTRRLEMALCTPRSAFLPLRAKSACALVCSVSLLWWILSQHGGQPAPSVRNASLSGMLSVGTARTLQDDNLAGGTVFQEQQCFATALSAHGDVVQPEMFPPAATASTVADHGTCAEQPHLQPPASRLLPSAYDPPPVIKTEPERSYAKRVGLSKRKRARKAQGAGKDVTA